jgi:hypothetical protein
MTAVDDGSVDWELVDQEAEIEEQQRNSAFNNGRVRYGTNLVLEEEANEIIFGHLRGISSREEKSDILTPWKEKNRLSKEVYNVTGFPQPSIRNGMFHRTLNRARPWLNSRDGIAQTASRQDHSIAMKHFNGTGGSTGLEIRDA